MSTTREQAQAYAYDNRRQITSFLRGTDEALRDPRRRLNRSLAGGIAMAVLIMAVFGVIGFLGGGRGPALPESGAVAVSKTGDHYVILDGVAHPALNMASALLVGGGDLTQVKASVLDGVPRGLPVGIPFAPDALPDPEKLSADPWSVCAIPSNSAAVAPRVISYVGVPVPDAAQQPGEGMLLRSVPGDRVWLVTEGRRHLLPGPVQAELGLQRDDPVPLPVQIVDTIPEAQPIGAPPVERGAQPVGDVPGGSLTGDVLRSGPDGPAQQLSLVRPDGLTPISPLVARLLLSTGSRERTVDARQITAADVSAEPLRGDPTWPDAVPSIADLQRDQPMCVSTVPGDSPLDAPWRVQVHVPQTVPRPAEVFAVAPSNNGQLPGLVNAVAVPAGSGAVVRSVTASGADGAFTLITDTGLTYAFGSAEDVARLRYSPQIAPSVPTPFVALLPQGPTLSADTATREYIPAPN